VSEKIALIKHVRTRTGVGLKLAKVVVDAGLHMEFMLAFRDAELRGAMMAPVPPLLERAATASLARLSPDASLEDLDDALNMAEEFTLKFKAREQERLEAELAKEEGNDS
jgi:hypothetical protein